jgi:hypothetical protein
MRVFSRVERVLHLDNDESRPLDFFKKLRESFGLFFLFYKSICISCGGELKII